MSSYALMNRFTASAGAESPDTMPTGAPNISGNMPTSAWGQGHRIRGRVHWRNPYGEPHLQSGTALQGYGSMGEGSVVSGIPWFPIIVGVGSRLAGWKLKSAMLTEGAITGTITAAAYFAATKLEPEGSSALSTGLGVGLLLSSAIAVATTALSWYATGYFVKKTRKNPPRKRSRKSSRSRKRRSRR